MKIRRMEKIGMIGLFVASFTMLITVGLAFQCAIYSYFHIHLFCIIIPLIFFVLGIAFDRYMSSIIKRK